ncbi:MAG TPA: slipin family protein, partial [Armatimonadetes bacterium]|nr:slipin family protein [Armatimonadota bacterium]
MGNAGWLIGLAVVGLVVGVQGLRVVQEYERGIVFRFGRLAGVRGPGLRLLVPFVDRMVKVSLRLAVLDVPKQDVITRDNVPVRVNAVVFFQVEDAVQAVIEVANYTQATSQKAQTTLRSVLGECELDELLASREKINQELRVIIDRETERWGVRIRGVEVKDVELPEEMQRAMARQAEAERER